LNKSFWFIWCI